MIYKVVKVTAENEEVYPHISSYVNDEEDLFVIDENGEFWSASEFFYMHGVDIKTFETG